MSRYSDEQKRESLRRAHELLEQLDARSAYQPAGEEAEPEPWPREWDSGPSPNDRLIRHGIRLSDPNGLERWREEPRERDRRREQFREQERAEQSERWLADRLKRERAHTLGLVAELIAVERQHLLEVVGKAIGQSDAKLRDEIQAALDQHGARITELETQQRAHRSKSGETLDLPALPVLRRRSSDAA